MQLNLRFEGANKAASADKRGSSLVDDDDEDRPNMDRASDDEDGTTTAASQRKADEGLSPEQAKMVRTLNEKKLFVTNKLISALGHKNRDIEASLNACAVLIELVESEKTLEIFFEDEGRLVGHMFDLGIDPSNGPNQ